MTYYNKQGLMNYLLECEYLTEEQKKKLTPDALKGKLKKIINENYTDQQKTEMTRNPPIGKPDIKKIKNKNYYNDYYLDALLIMFKTENQKNLYETIQDSISKALITEKKFEDLIISKLEFKTQEALKNDINYEIFKKQMYIKEQNLKKQTISAIKEFEDTYVQPLRKDIDRLTSKEKTIYQTLQSNISDEEKIERIKLTLTYP